MALFAVSLALILIGFKGLSRTGIQLSEKLELKGTTARLFGTVCLAIGIGLMIF